jgi:hypothetical protein
MEIQHLPTWFNFSWYSHDAIYKYMNSIKSSKWKEEQEKENTKRFNHGLKEQDKKGACRV